MGPKKKTSQHYYGTRCPPLCSMSQVCALHYNQIDIELCKNTGSAGDYGLLDSPMTTSAEIQPLPCCQCENKYTGDTMTYHTAQPSPQLGQAPSHRYLCQPTREATGSETTEKTSIYRHNQRNQMHLCTHVPLDSGAVGKPLIRMMAIGST